MKGDEGRWDVRAVTLSTEVNPPTNDVRKEILLFGVVLSEPRSLPRRDAVEFQIALFLLYQLSSFMSILIFHVFNKGTSTFIILLCYQLKHSVFVYYFDQIRF